jgi:SAM-dependent methyltransferase
VSLPPALTPAELLGWIAKRPERTEACIECGAGLGELAAFFRATFRSVTATDIAPLAIKSPYGVKIVKAAAEHLPAPDSSVDLLISMQALHHFDRAAHLDEAARVLRPGGLFVALCWGEIVLPAPILRAWQPTFSALAQHWEDSRAWVLSGYANLAFPGTPLALPAARMTRQMTTTGLKAEIQRWSAFRRALAAGVKIPEPSLPGIEDPQAFPVHWPVLGKAFQA